MNDNLEKSLIAMAQANHIPINGSMELLPLCNMNCDMCYVRLSRSEMEAQGRLRTAEEWLPLGREMQKAGVLFLLLTGGEPLLYPNFKEVYLGLKKMGMILTINTNGTLLNEEWADFFAANKPRRINITLYGDGEDTYRELCHYPSGYEKAVRAIELLTARNVDVKINGSMVRLNQGTEAHLGEIAERTGAALNIDTYMYPAERERTLAFNKQARLSPEESAAAKMRFLRCTRTPEQFRALKANLAARAACPPDADGTCNGTQCQAGKSSFAINWQGNMQPCVMMNCFSVPVFEVGFQAAWEQVSEYVASLRLSTTCASCTLRDVCDTCAACALLETGSFDGVPEYMCRYTAELVRLSSVEAVP